jgi:hypothetical protein
MGKPINKPLSIPLSFKKNEKWLYDAIKSHSSYTGFVKDALVKAIAAEGIYQPIQQIQPVKSNPKSSSTNQPSTELTFSSDEILKSLGELNK